MSGSTHSASRVLMAICSVQALLALGLPFALEDNADPLALVPFDGTEVWSGWSLARASRLDGHQPVSTAFVIVLVAATVVLVILAWLALERPVKWPAAAVAVVGAALLVSSVLIGNAVNGTFGDGHVGTPSWGLAVWRVALLLAVAAAVRALVLAEAETAAEAAALRRS